MKDDSTVPWVALCLVLISASLSFAVEERAPATDGDGPKIIQDPRWAFWDEPTGLRFNWSRRIEETVGVGCGGGISCPDANYKRYGRRGGGNGGGRASQTSVVHGLVRMFRGDLGSWNSPSLSIVPSNRFTRPHVRALPGATGVQPGDIGYLALAIVAAGANGHGINGGSYGRDVRAGIRYLTQIQNPSTGSLIASLEVGSKPDAGLYEHAIATVAMVEAYGLSTWPMLRGPAQRSVDFLVASLTEDAAWKSPTPSEVHYDLWTAAWTTMALASAQDFGLDVPVQAIEVLRQRIERTPPMAAAPNHTPRSVSRGTAQAAVALLFHAVLLREDPQSSAVLHGYANVLARHPPNHDPKAGPVDYHYESFASHAMFQVGGERWDRWQEALQDQLVGLFYLSRTDYASWDPDLDAWTADRGAGFSTALCVLSLSASIRYGRVTLDQR